MRVRDEMDELVAAHGDRLLRVAYLLTGEQSAAEDLLQDTLLRAQQKWAAVSRADNTGAYVRQMLVNLHLSQARRRRVATVSLEIAGSAAWVGTDDPGDLVAQRQQLRDALQRLPPRQRAVLVLRFYEDLDDTAIGDALNISPSTVRSTAARGLTSIRSTLDDPDYERNTRNAL
ncbi:SigE family RNA polymerase sigma factor [Nocardioides maradonensis]